MTVRLIEFKSDDRKKVIDLVTCNIEICRVVGLRQSLVEVDMIRFPLINTPLQRGGMWGADLQTVSTVSLRRRGAKTVKTVAIDR